MMQSPVPSLQPSTTPAGAARDLAVPVGGSFVARMLVAVRALAVLVKAPDDAVAGAVFATILDGPTLRHLAKEMSQEEQGRRLLAERPTLQRSSLDLAALAQLPEGAVGRAFAQYFIDNKISPFETPGEPSDDGDYLVRWYRETHDLHHVVTQYGTDPVGEMELQAFVLGNMRLRTSMMSLFFGALLSIGGLPPIWTYARRLRQAYRRGRQSKNLLNVRYEQFFARSLEELRSTLRIPRLHA